VGVVREWGRSEGGGESEGREWGWGSRVRVRVREEWGEGGSEEWEEWGRRVEWMSEGVKWVREWMSEWGSEWVVTRCVGWCIWVISAMHKSERFYAACGMMLMVRCNGRALHGCAMWCNVVQWFSVNMSVHVFVVEECRCSDWSKDAWCRWYIKRRLHIEEQMFMYATNNHDMHHTLYLFSVSFIVCDDLSDIARLHSQSGK
jgi:hypothetical protein